MRWQNRRRSDNIEDRRGDSSGSNGSGGNGSLGGGRGIRIPLRGKTGLIIIVVIVVAGIFGVDLSGLVTGEPININQSKPTATQYQPVSKQDQQLAEFTSVILASTEDVWQQQFEKWASVISSQHWSCIVVQRAQLVVKDSQ